MLHQLITLDRKTKAKWLKRVTHIAVWIPLVMLFMDFWFYRLGPDPIREVILRTGEWSLIILLASLAVTPLNIIFGWKQLIPLRKVLGLYAFMYVCLHLLSFVGLDYQFAWAFIIPEITERYYILFGFTAFLILLPLAATSTKWAMRKLGKKWKRLHQWVYLAGILGIVHFALSLKSAYTEPAIYGLILFFLLVVRLTPIKKRLSRLRHSNSHKSKLANRSNTKTQTLESKRLTSHSL
ncbi:MAG: sulfite oxidase heme-binding subunit YedZ [Ardenticatenaceae bacterium]